MNATANVYYISHQPRHSGGKQDAEATVAREQFSQSVGTVCPISAQVARYDRNEFIRSVARVPLEALQALSETPQPIIISQPAEDPLNSSFHETASSLVGYIRSMAPSAFNADLLSSIFNMLVLLSGSPPKAQPTPVTSYSGRAKMDMLRTLRHGWDGEDAPAPSAAAVEAAKTVLLSADKVGLNFLEADADVLGGVGLWFSWPESHADGEARRWAWVACMNSGKITAVLREAGAKQGSAKYLSIDSIEQDLRDIYSFLSGG